MSGTAAALAHSAIIGVGLGTWLSGYPHGSFAVGFGVALCVMFWRKELQA